MADTVNGAFLPGSSLSVYPQSPRQGRTSIVNQSLTSTSRACCASSHPRSLLIAQLSRRRTVRSPRTNPLTSRPQRENHRSTALATRKCHHRAPFQRHALRTEHHTLPPARHVHPAHPTPQPIRHTHPRNLPDLSPRHHAPQPQHLVPP